MISKDWTVFKLKLTTNSHEKDLALDIDKITWKQFIQQALTKNHGIFGQGIEYELLANNTHRFEDKTDNIAFFKVSKLDSDKFSNALNIYINTKLVHDAELVCTQLQRTDNLESLEVEDSETLWKKKLIENWDE